ncbi:GTP 3',8-cyclase MoaA [Methanopyrus kandleri]|uniref:Probable GTP 3',8-cyclase n=2 Tax=Methanopyrus kandleri TaxID=2320 RepID=MOAA_METKA|nr:GTP 3',8-cyclase MoaA [Methanopyrus kandleri]Q8TV60.1 RecName: Full=Probable GTP 3',8-cyclase; AltName: Full=Molybdenum cofactor biosynthesis protein A [Methanopyrus kandleri AV19]AAM02753.1 Molybdenum cofactor biosynthesis enzyme [Methanopyrus kandleri AV19]HII71013.1 GTP 3',8-cyclase MoaA [Methanopyrus kandleri]
MRDALGREVRSVRISVTMRCNMACVYCHREGERPGRSELSAAEWGRLLRACAEIGVRKVKITGGEPLLRRDLIEIIENAEGFEEVSLVTNGVLLADYAGDLAEAGLDRVNVSLDTVDRKLYRKLTRSRFSPDDVIRGIEAAVSEGLTPVKVNVVLTSETVKTLPTLVEELADLEGLKLQLIEPMGSIPGFRPAHAEDGLRALGEYEPELERVRTFHSREVYRLNNGMAVEVVKPMDGVMCEACTRIRLTHDGKYKGCLMAPPKPLPRDDFGELVRTLKEYVRTRDDTFEVHQGTSVMGRMRGDVSGR